MSRRLPRACAALLLSVSARAALPSADFDALTRQSSRFLGDVPVLPHAARIEGGAAAAAAGTRWEALEQELARSHPEIPADAVHRLLSYLQRHPAPNMRFAAVIDMDRPNSERRLHVINLADGSVESFLVAHGSGSGGETADRFSDRPQSRMTSLGVYLTGDEYDGKHGRSLTLLGQEASNDDAASRAVVIHGAAYVSDEYLREHGRIGDSWGCPAVDFKYRDHIIDELGGGAALLIYHS